MENAWSILGELGAVDEGGKLTPLGRHMVYNPAVLHSNSADIRAQSMLPVDLRLGKVSI